MILKIYCVLGVLGRGAWGRLAGALGGAAWRGSVAVQPALMLVSTWLALGVVWMLAVWTQSIDVGCVDVRFDVGCVEVVGHADV